MNKCPDYYLLADGREFAEFTETDVSKAILSFVVNQEIPWPSWHTMHCLFSAMEHGFRLGRKEGEADTDAAAEEFWYEQARISYTRQHKNSSDIDDLIKMARRLVYEERIKLEDL